MVDLEGVQEAIAQQSHQKEAWRRQLAELALRLERFETGCRTLTHGCPANQRPLSMADPFSTIPWMALRSLPGLGVVIFPPPA